MTFSFQAIQCECIARIALQGLRTEANSTTFQLRPYMHWCQGRIDCLAALFPSDITLRGAVNEARFLLEDYSIRHRKETC